MNNQDYYRNERDTWLSKRDRQREMFQTETNRIEMSKKIQIDLLRKLMLKQVKEVKVKLMGH